MQTESMRFAFTCDCNRNYTMCSDIRLAKPETVEPTGCHGVHGAQGVKSHHEYQYGWAPSVLYTSSNSEVDIVLFAKGPNYLHPHTSVHPSIFTREPHTHMHSYIEGSWLIDRAALWNYMLKYNLMINYYQVRRVLNSE